MAFLIDTSLWIDIYRDRTGNLGKFVKSICGGHEPFFARPIALELLQGCATEAEWVLMHDHLATQDYLEMSSDPWIAASRIYFDLRRVGKTVRSSLDCCIAQLALESNCTLLHKDGDFEIIATIRPLKQRRVEIQVP